MATRKDKKLWIGGAIRHPGALHRALGVPHNEVIPSTLLRQAIEHPERFAVSHTGAMHVKRMALLAARMRRMPHHGPRRR